MKHRFVIARIASAILGRSRSILSWIPLEFATQIRGMTILLLLTSPATALNVDDKLPEAAQEMRAQNLFHALRCVVCQSEAIADSPAEVAKDMRRSVRESIAAGKSDDDIKTSLVAHYGERVLMMPEKNPRNALLWFAPFLLLLAGAWLAAKSVFRKENP